MTSLQRNRINELDQLVEKQRDKLSNYSTLSSKRLGLKMPRFRVLLLTLFVPTLLDSSRGPGGGQICPPLNYGYRSMFSLFSFSQGSFLGCKGSESKNTAIYLRKYVP